MRGKIPDPYWQRAPIEMPTLTLLSALQILLGKSFQEMTI